MYRPSFENSSFSNPLITVAHWPTARSFREMSAPQHCKRTIPGVNHAVSSCPPQALQLLLFELLWCRRYYDRCNLRDDESRNRQAAGLGQHEQVR